MECSVCHKTISTPSLVAKSTADVNGDGKVNSVDALLILRYSIGFNELISSQTAFLNADVNGDGKVNSADALIVLRISIGVLSI